MRSPAPSPNVPSAPRRASWAPTLSLAVWAVLGGTAVAADAAQRGKLQPAAESDKMGKSLSNHPMAETSVHDVPKNIGVIPSSPAPTNETPTPAPVKETAPVDPKRTAIIEAARKKHAEAQADYDAKNGDYKKEKAAPGGMEKYFETLYDPQVPQFVEKFDRRIKEWKAGLEKVIADGKEGKATLQDVERARNVLEVLNQKHPRSVKFEGAALMGAFMESGNSVGASGKFGFEGVSDFVDEHVKGLVGIVVDANGTPMPGVGLNVEFGTSGERFNYSLSAGTVNFVTATASGSVGVNLNNAQVGRDLAKKNAGTRESVSLVAAGGAAAMGQQGAILGVQYERKSLDGVERQRAFLGKAFSEMATHFNTIGELDALKFDQLPSLQYMEGGEDLFTWARADLRACLTKDDAWGDSWNGKSKHMAKLSAEAQVISGSYEGLLHQKLGANWAGVGAGFGEWSGFLFPWAGVGLEVVSGKITKNKEQGGHIEGLMASRYGLKPVSEKNLYGATGVSAKETARSAGSLTTLENQGHNRVRISVPKGLENSVRVVLKNVPVEGGGTEPKVTVQTGASVKSIGVYKVMVDNYKEGDEANAVREILIIADPQDVSGERVTIEVTDEFAPHAAKNLKPRPKGETVAFTANTLVEPGQVEGVSKLFFMVAASDKLNKAAKIDRLQGGKPRERGDAGGSKNNTNTDDKGGGGLQ